MPSRIRKRFENWHDATIVKRSDGGVNDARAINRGTVRERFGLEKVREAPTVTVKMNGSDDEKWRLERAFDG